MSIKKMRWAVEANKEMSDFDAMKEFYVMLYKAFGMDDAVIKADLADTTERELGFLLSCLA